MKPRSAGSGSGSGGLESGSAEALDAIELLSPDNRSPAAPETETPQQLGFRMPAEWEPHAATWLAWPYSEDWPGKLEAVRWVFCEMARLLHEGERVRLIVRDAPARDEVAGWLEAQGVDVARVDFFVSATDRTWTRDNLPLFVRSQSGYVGAVKFRFNGWARYEDHQLDEQAGQAVARAHGACHWFPTVQVGERIERVVLEGGAIDVDGQGTLLTTRGCLLGTRFARNPGVSQAQLEQLLGAYLGIEQVIWLGEGIAGDDTSGHVDDFARFVRPATVVLAQSEDPTDADYLPLREAKQCLLDARDARGRSIQVVELPMPRPVYYRGERLPASYANFYIANHRVLVPTFNDRNDQRALSIFRELFPEREVVGVFARDLVVGLGTLHCSTQQEPLAGEGGGTGTGVG